MLHIGSIAPDFELKLHTGVRFRLSDQRGERNVVLHFYPKEIEWGTRHDGSLLEEQLKEIRNLDATVIGVNGESVERHKRFAKQNHVPFPLASDPQLEVSRNYRAVWLRGLAIRKVSYIIDKNQTIRGIAHHELLVDRHWNYIVRVLRELMEEEAVRTYNRQAWNL